MSSNYSTVGFNHSKVAFASCDRRIEYRMPPSHEPLRRVRFMENATLPCLIKDNLQQILMNCALLGVVVG